MTVWSLSDNTFNFVTVKYCFSNFFAPLGLEYISDPLWLPDQQIKEPFWGSSGNLI